MAADLLILGGDVVTMNPARDVLVGGRWLSPGTGSWASDGRRSSVRCIRRRRAGRDRVRGTPGMVNAHQHHTGDPLVKCCIPDLIMSGDAIFEWAVPIARRPLPRRRRARRDDQRRRCAAARRHDRGRGRNGRQPRPRRRGAARDRGPWHGRALGMGRRRRALQRAGRRGDRPPAAGARSVARRRPDRGMGHARRSQPRQRRAVRRRRRPGPLHRPVDDDAHVADELRSDGVPGPHRQAPAAPSRRPRRASDRLLLAHAVWLDDEEVELVLDTRTAIAYCPWAYLRLGQGGATRHGRHADIVERGGRVALGCDAETPATSATSSVPPLLPPASPATRGSTPAVRRRHGVRAGHDPRGRGDRHGGPDRLARGRQAGRCRRPRCRLRSTGCRAATSHCSSCGAPTAGPCATSWSTARSSCATASARRSTSTSIRGELQAAQRSLLERAGIQVPHRWPHHDAS